MTTLLHRVRLEPGPVQIPVGCAGCGASASFSRAEHGLARGAVIHYCERCFALLDKGTTRRLSVLMAQGLAAGSLAAFLPLVRPWQSLLALMGVVIVGWAIPFGLAQVLARRGTAVQGHGRAVFVLTRRDVVGVCQAWMKQLGALNRTLAVPVSAWRLLSVDLVLRSALLGAALCVAFVMHRFTHPEVRIVNLLDAPLQVVVAGHSVVDGLIPSSGESPHAGRTLRVPAGSFEWVARGRDGVVGRAQIRTSAGAQHLYAPGHHNHCFWLETTEYGKEQSGTEPTTVRRPVTLKGGFAALGSTVDAWFSAAPPSDRFSLPVSGGKLIVVRQAACEVGSGAEAQGVSGLRPE